MENARDEAVSLEHLMDHYPKNRFCKACQCGKIQSQQSRRSKGLGPPPKEFGDQVTAYHIISRSARSESVTGALDSLLIYDRATRWVDCYPVRSQGVDDVYNRFLQFAGPWQKIKYVYTDDSPALKAALAEVRVCHDTSIPGQPKTNGVAERQVKEVVHGIRTILVKAGLPNCFWPYAMRHFCFARNIKIDKNTGVSPHYKRFGREFKGPRIPFGAQVMYKPSPIYERKWKADGKDKWSNMRPGIFLGYNVLSGGRWRDALFVADREDLALQDLSYYARSTMKRTHVQTVRKMR